MNTDRDREARGLLERVWLGDFERFVDAIAQALAARERTVREEFKACGLADDQGRPRKVLGRLVLTSDGAIVSHGATIHHPVSFLCNDAQHSVVDGPSFDMVLAEASVADQDHKRPPFVCWGGPQHDCAYINECYSTREAALAAKEGQ